MDTIQELKYYCETSSPTGVLLLTGEWGCGKTYLINNKLQEELKEKHIIVRISLFGISCTDDLKNVVKKEWLLACGRISDNSSKIVGNMMNVGKKITSVIGNFFPDVKKISDSIFSINFFDLIVISNKYLEKNVVLVFDDLERCKLEKTDVLGIINDYCENQGFNVIIVANEEKIKSPESTSLSYSEIKEKIVQHTIKYCPDYREIVLNIIEDLFGNDTEYLNFLRKNIDGIISLFKGENEEGLVLDKFVLDQIEKANYDSREEKEKEIEKTKKLLKSRSHNLRSLKCSLQDYRRIYYKMNENDVIRSDSRRLYAFISYVLTMRANQIPDSGGRYGGLFDSLYINKLYYGYYDEKFLFPSVKKWIREGEWVEEDVIADINREIESLSLNTPLGKLKKCEITELEEDDIREVYKEYLDEAYAGKLTLDEYVNLLKNLMIAREIKFIFPESIDWGNIERGVKKTIKKSERDMQNIYRGYGLFEKELNSDELKIYKMIEHTGTINATGIKNKNLYIQGMLENPQKSLLESRERKFAFFDKDMLEVTYNAYQNAKNEIKSNFSTFFPLIWIQYMSFAEDEKEYAISMFDELIDRLDKLKKKYIDEDKMIAVYHTNQFIDSIKKLM